MSADMKAIVKVQVPLSDPAAAWYAYDQQRSHPCLFEPDAKMRAAMGGKKKGYFAALWVNGKWVFGDKVRDRAW